MTVYSYAQLEQLWLNAGGAKAQAPMAAAIALAESGGNSAAMNYTDNNGTQTSVGLWQVSSGTHQYPSSWTTPAGNASEAVAKYQAAGGWSPWGTYSSGAYKRYLNGATTPDPNVPAGSGGGGAQPATLTAADTSLASDCLIGIPNPAHSIPVIGGLFSTNLTCLFTKPEARALAGGVIMLASGVVALTGVLILAAYGLKRSGALDKVAKVAGVVPVPGAQAAAAGLRSASAAAG
jgi:hypothetical protein